jgi:hypothetical protein
MTIESLVGNDLEGSYRGLIEVASQHLSEVLVAFKVIVSNPRLNRTTPKCRYRMWPFKQPAYFYRANTRKTFWEPELHGFFGAEYRVRNPIPTAHMSKDGPTCFHIESKQIMRRKRDLICMTTSTVS